MKPINALSLLVATGALALAMLSFDADAQRKLYRWTDKDGKVHYTDQLPAEAVKDKQEELNNQGMAVRTTERARTPEEQAAWEAEQKKLEEERRIAEEKAKMDAVLTSSYPTEADLARAYKERFDLLAQSLESARVGIRSQEKSLADLLAHAADLERNGQNVPVGIKDSINLTRSQVNEQRDYLERRENEHTALQAEYDRLLARYRELKAAPSP
ncbi:DUF4124 domain-containing protein [Xanthomonadaceae bacterium JHOS43]|nr:DUF4124 domain-containing protein [Xanthomonadaceae bacterium JHOS43]MCX7562379.1 DUF4124 domain-containing protein [Xanthomonadaceae bacterium XH05]